MFKAKCTDFHGSDEGVDAVAFLNFVEICSDIVVGDLNVTDGNGRILQ